MSDWEDKKDDVSFTARMSEQENCICDCCHGTGRVMVFRYPKTKFFDGQNLTSKYHEVWICNSCYQKAEKAILGMLEG